MVPHLPAAEIRDAIEAGDWPRATALLATHQRELAGTLAATDLSSVACEPWFDLLLAQRALLAELRDARTRVAEALQRLTEDHRRARAWLRELA
jgi:hypothetical protein